MGTQLLPRLRGLAPGLQRPEAHLRAYLDPAARPRGPLGVRRRLPGFRGHLRRAVRPHVHPARPDPPAGVRAAVHHCHQGHRDHPQTRHRVRPGQVEAPVPVVPQVLAARASAVRRLPAREPGAASGAVRRRVLDHRRAHHRFRRHDRAASRPDPDPDHPDEARRLDDSRHHHHRGTYWPA